MDDLSQADTAQGYPDDPLELIYHLLPDGMTLTDKGAPCMDGSGSACLDLFSQVNPSASRESFDALLASAWAQDPTTALRLVFQLGNCRKGGGGKLDRRNFIRGLLWMWRNGQRRTVLLNLEEIHRQGCYKDLLTLVHEAIFDPEYSERNDRAVAEREAARKARGKGKGPLLADVVKREESRNSIKQEFAVSDGRPLEEIWLADPGSALGGFDAKALLVCEEGKSPMKYSRVRKVGYRPSAGGWVDGETRSRFQTFCRAREVSIAESNRAERAMRAAAVRERRDAMNAEEEELYSAVASIFARDVARELRSATEGSPLWHPPMYPWRPEAPASPACKWAPTPGGMHDKATMLSSAITKGPSLRGLLESGVVGRGPIEHRFQRALSTVRRASGVPESFVARREWSLVNYRVVPSKCMALNGARVFGRHDTNRHRLFQLECLGAFGKRAAGDRGAPALHTGSLLPHDIVEAACAAAASGDCSIQYDLHWGGIVSRVKAARDTRRALTGMDTHIVVVCDVSGSMGEAGGIPMRVAVSLSLALAESAPRGAIDFGRMITFHETPEVVEIDGIPDYDTGEGIEAGGLAKRVEMVRSMPWGSSTNIEATFELILDMCVQNEVSDEQAKRIVVIVLSDMEFDECRGNRAAPWETTHQTICSRWVEAGYSSAPKIAYWNLRSDAKGSTPVASTQVGAATISGYSPSILESILDGALCDDNGFNPEAVMRFALDRPCYGRLRVAGP